jgi:hypothetical protein
MYVYVHNAHDTERLQHLKKISDSNPDRLSPETERQLKRLKAIGMYIY